jgi:hypothetical protein
LRLTLKINPWSRQGGANNMKILKEAFTDQECNSLLFIARSVGLFVSIYDSTIRLGAVNRKSTIIFDDFPVKKVMIAANNIVSGKLALGVPNLEYGEFGRAALNILSYRLSLLNKRDNESTSNIFRSWVYAILNGDQATRAYSSLWDASDFGVSEEVETVSKYKVDTKSEKTQLFHRVEAIIGLKTRKKGNDEILIEVSNASSTGSKLQRLLYVPNIKKHQFFGVDPIGKYDSYQRKLKISKIKDNAINLLADKSNGPTLFEGGASAPISQALIQLLIDRISAPNFQDYAVVGKGGKEFLRAKENWLNTDVSLVFEAWVHGIRQADFMSNERSVGTARIMAKQYKKRSI